VDIETPIETKKGKDLLCPACKEKLTPMLTDDGAGVEECVGCGGIWVDFFDEKTFLQIHPDVFTIDELRRLRRYYKPYEKIELIQYRRCPICNEMMSRRNWGSASGVIVDRCELDGTWFDAGEPEKIREFIKLGGIEYEKKVYVDEGDAGLGDRLRCEVKRLDGRITINSSKPMWARFLSGLFGVDPY